MKRPSFQFYPADWRNNAKLRRCSEAARGAWMDILCVLHDSDEYGVCRWPLSDLARSAGVSLKLVKELVVKEVLKGGDNGCMPYVYTPVSGRVHGEPVVLVEAKDTHPCWYCSRLVRDEYVRLKRGNSSQFSSENQPAKPSLKEPLNHSPKGGIGERQGDGSTSSSTSTPSIPVDNSINIGKVTKGEPENSPTLAGQACLLMTKAGIFPTNPSHPDLVAAITEGITPEEIADVAAECVQKGKLSMAYVIATVRSRKRESRAPPTQEFKPRANDNFQGKSYVGTPIDKLPAELRDSVAA